MVQAGMPAMGSDRERQMKLARSLLISCCAAQFLTGHGLVWSAAWRLGTPALGHLFVFLCTLIKVSGKLRQLNSSRISNSPDPLEIKVWVIPLGKEPQPAEVLAEGKRNMERVVEEGNERR